MLKFNNVCLAFDIDSPDKKIINFASKFINAKKVFVSFINNVTNDFNEISCELCDDILKAKEQKEKIQEIEDYIRMSLGISVETEIVLKTYNYNEVTDSIKNINAEAIDLIITSNKNTHKDFVNFLKRVVRNSTASLLILPEGFNGEIKLINVGIDFSEYSTLALEHAFYLAKVFNFDSINLINVYSVPYGYHKLGKSYEEFSKKLEKNIDNNFVQLLNKFENISVTANKKIVNADDISKTLDELSGKSTLLVIGDKGKNASASVLIGSVPESIILNTDNPVLMIRSKDNNF